MRPCQAGDTSLRVVLTDSCQYQTSKTPSAKVSLGFIGRTHETGIPKTCIAAPASQPQRNVPSLVGDPLPSGVGEQYSFLDQLENYFGLTNVVVISVNAAAYLRKEFALAHGRVSSLKKILFLNGHIVGVRRAWQLEHLFSVVQ